LEGVLFCSFSRWSGVAVGIVIIIAVSTKREERGAKEAQSRKQR
jgi:hypothetical protein